MDNKCMPEIRFDSFSGGWENKRLGNISNSYSGGTPNVNEQKYYGGIIPFIRSAEINSSFTEQFITEEGLKNSSAKLVTKGDILYALYGATSGEVGIAKIDGAINQAILAIKMQSGNNSDFIYQWLKKKKKVIVNTYLQGGQGNLSGSIVKDLILKVPSGIEEQQKIGEFFKQLDDRIALQQRHVEQLKQSKQGFLQKMFPKDGELVPELRLNGFTEDWSVVKLESIVERITRKNKDLESTLPLTISAQYGLIDQNVFFNKQVASKDMSNYLLIRKGEFAYNKSYSRGYPLGVIRRLDLHEKGALSTLYIAFKPLNVNSDFLLSYYNTNKWHKEVIKRASEGARNHGLLNISPKDFFETELKLPNEIKEQQKIGEFFKQLDDLIAKNERELELLQETKKGFLQKMFV